MLRKCWSDCFWVETENFVFWVLWALSDKLEVEVIWFWINALKVREILICISVDFDLVRGFLLTLFNCNWFVLFSCEGGLIPFCFLFFLVGWISHWVIDNPHLIKLIEVPIYVVSWLDNVVYSWKLLNRWIMNVNNA